jgi:hypothetical protein
MGGDLEEDIISRKRHNFATCQQIKAIPEHKLAMVESSAKAAAICLSEACGFVTPIDDGQIDDILWDEIEHICGVGNLPQRDPETNRIRERVVRGWNSVALGDR